MKCESKYLNVLNSTLKDKIVRELMYIIVSVGEIQMLKQINFNFWPDISSERETITNLA